MRIVIDRDAHGNEHFIETTPTVPFFVEHPDGSGRKIDLLTMLAYHNANVKAREIGGWHEVNQLPGEAAPMTRWERLVSAANQIDAPPELRALKLK